MSKSLYIIGAGGVGAHIVWNFNDYKNSTDNRYIIQEILDDDSSKLGMSINGITVSGPINKIFELQEVSVVIGIASPLIKKAILCKLADHPSIEFPTLISEHAWICRSCRIGKGSIIYPGVSINYNSFIGDFSIINMNASIGHDNTIGKYTSIAPGVNLAGYTVIEDMVEIGIGSSTRQKVRVGRESIIGGQSMVISDIPPETVYAGVPARKLTDISSDVDAVEPKRP